MRVISGSARGKRLGELSGMETRPTTDRVKEALFNIVQFELPGRQILDLFGGTGQLGIEALSRGAAGCTFVDMRGDAVRLIRRNLADTTLADKGRVVQGDSLEFLARCGEKFDVIFLDPPYSSGLLEAAMERKDPEGERRAADRDLMLHGFMLTLSGIPMLYSGDEIGQLNDYRYKEDPKKAADSLFCPFLYPEFHKFSFIFKGFLHFFSPQCLTFTVGYAIIKILK